LRIIKNIGQTMIDRKKTLQDLIEFRKKPSVMHAALSAFEWDCDEELVQMERRQIATVLQKYIAGETSDEEIEDWANLIEGRDDINYAEVEDVLHVLANPAITYKLTPSVAVSLIDNLRTPNTPLEPSR